MTQHKTPKADAEVRAEPPVETLDTPSGPADSITGPGVRQTTVYEAPRAALRDDTPEALADHFYEATNSRWRALPSSDTKAKAYLVELLQSYTRHLRRKWHVRD